MSENENILEATETVAGVKCVACEGNGWYVGHEDECNGWYVGHEDECYESGDCNCSGVQVQCDRCDGSGLEPIQCPVCSGIGDNMNWVSGAWSPCANCGGRGSLPALTQPTLSAPSSSSVSPGEAAEETHE